MGAADDTETATKNGGKISDTKGKRLYELYQEFLIMELDFIIIFAASFYKLK